jgi:hypothetical protein
MPLSIMILSIITLSAYAKGCYAVSFMMSVTIKFHMLSDIVPSVVMANAMTPLIVLHIKVGY